MGLSCMSCYDDSSLVERIDALEKNAVASIKEQINAIKASITSLEAVDAELKSTIKTLEVKDSTLQDDIDELKEADASLEIKIGELKIYVDEEISNTEDWVTATCATIEKYNEIVKELSALKEIVELRYSTLDKKIDDSIESIKAWINEALKGYYTSEEVDELLKSLKDDLDVLQAKLDNLLREFAIIFDDTEIGILAGGTTSVGYTITGATEKTTVKALGQNGWSAKVTPDGTDKGTITVTAPNPLTEDEIIVLVYDGEFRTIMSSINFVTGVVTPSQTAVELDAEAGTVDITVTSNLNYKVSIPEDARDWLSVIETKAMNTDTITFAYTECIGGTRKATISFYDESDTFVSSTIFIQHGNAYEVTLTKAGTLSNLINENDKWNIEALKISGEINGTDIRFILEMIGYSNDPEEREEGILTILDLSDAKIVEGGDYYKYDSMGNKFYTKNDELGDYMFFYSNLHHIILPKDIKVVGKYALGWCDQLQSVKMFENIEKIDDRAFCDSPNLQSIEIPNGVTYIGEQTFAGINVNTINIPNTVTYIGDEAFCNSGIVSVTIPNSVEFLGNGIFKGSVKIEEYHGKYASQDNKCLIYKDTLICYAYGNKDNVYHIPSEALCIGKNSFTGAQYLTSIIIPNNVHRIQDEAFQYVPLETIEIPTGVEHIEELAFVNCTTIKAFYGKYASHDNKCLIYDGAIIKYASALPDETYNIPEEVNEIGNSAFRQAKLKSIKFSSTVTKIGDDAFNSCYYLDNIEISDNLLTIGNRAFCYCVNLSSIELPDILTSIGESAFCQCEKLTTFIIPTSLKSIGEHAFIHCKNLKEIYCYPIEPPTIYPKYSTNYGYSLGGIDPIIYVPKGSFSKYQYSDFGYGYTIKEM